MMRENESVEEIRRLARYEFDLDVEEQTRLQGEGDAEVQRVSIKDACVLTLSVRGPSL